MATHSSVVAWRNPWTEEPGRPQSMGVTKKLDRTEQLSMQSTALHAQVLLGSYLGTINIFSIL